MGKGNWFRRERKRTQGESRRKRAAAKKLRGAAVDQTILSVELLEDRRVLATFLVNNTADSNNDGVAFAGSLRWAVERANLTEEPDTILFSDNIFNGGAATLTYTVRAEAAPTYANLDDLNAYIAGRHPAEERATVVALPNGAPSFKRADAPVAGARPIVHVLIPSGFGDPQAGLPLSRAWGYGWENMHHGLDGVAIDIPALKVAAGPGGLIPLNIRIKDPIWTGRDMIDVSVSVRPGEARTLWLDLRDRILTNDSLYLTIAAGSAEFGPQALEGARIRLVFKPREEATAEHVADRFNQVKDNWAFLVEEHTASKRQGLSTRSAPGRRRRCGAGRCC